MVLGLMLQKLVVPREPMINSSLLFAGSVKVE